MHAAVELEKYSTITNPQPVAIRMIGKFLDTLAIRKISQRLDLRAAAALIFSICLSALGFQSMSFTLIIISLK